MKRIEDDIGAFAGSFRRDYTSAVNLLMHPVAASAALGALGFGLASQALGIWLGAVAGAIDAPRRLAAESAAKDAAPPRRRPVRLKLVAAGSGTKLSAPGASAFARTRPQGLAKAASPDDLKAISGIGPRLELALNRSGIRTWDQIAALDEAGIALLDERLRLGGRIGRDDWIGQAKELARDESRN